MGTEGGQFAFAGTPRYQVLARIGQGGMGTVFQVFDRERGEEVALKTLLKLSPTKLQLFKQEFRALADVAHPNLVSLYEMSVADGVWYFTMELIRGPNFLEHVWGTTGVAEPETVLSEEDPSGFESAIGLAGLRVLSIDALRDCTAQLVRGLSALHAAGKLHLDVKPANVLVAVPARVVLLDFGLVTEIAEAREPGARLVGGTWAYMAPERLSRSAVTPASDLYSVGVMLYQALTGRVPFTMKDIDLGLSTGRSVLVPPQRLVPAVPLWLSDLCTEMLAFNPADRPPASEVLARLGEPQRGAEVVTVVDGGEEEVLAGRDASLAALAGALRELPAGRSASVRLRGASGIGKSTLVRHFLRGLRIRKEAMVLEGRCYDRESVPYKALDTIIDRLTDQLAAQPSEITRGYVPPDPEFLAELFPVLRRVKAFAESRPPRGEDAQERRWRAFRALRILLGRLAAKTPLVLFIDDFQWGDVDSAVALGELLAPPDPPRILLVTCDRGEDAASALHDLIRRAAGFEQGFVSREIDLEPLDDQSALRVARLLLGRYGQQEDLGDAIAREAGGNPYLLRELAQNPVTEPIEKEESGRRASLERVLRARIEQLPASAQALLEVVATAGRPLDQQAAVEAAQVTGQDRSAIAMLRASRLLTVRTMAGGAFVDTYHDRIRQAVGDGLPPERLRQHHLSLAVVLEHRPGTDPETLAEHLLAAGAGDRAGQYVLLAAEQASRKLAFDRAANLYRRSIELLADHARPWELQGRLGEALANAGKSQESGDAYLRASTALAAAEPGHASVLTWRRRSFEEYLRAGLLDKGDAQMRAMAEQVGIRLPRSRGQKILALLVERAKLGTRRIRIPDGADGRGGSDRDRICADVCWGAAIPISMIDPLLSNFLYTRHLMLALKMRDPRQIARGLATEVTSLASLGGARRLARARELTALAETILAKSPDAYTQGMVHCARAVVAHMSADFRGSATHNAQWEEMIRSVPGASFELGTVQTFMMLALSYLGRLREMGQRLAPALREIEDRGNLLHGTSLRVLETFLHLRDDQPGDALARADRAIAAWPGGGGFHLQHHFHLIAAGQAHLYAGNASAAWDLVEKAWPALKASLFLSVRAMADEVRFLRARAALAVAATNPANGVSAADLLRRALKDARKIARSGLDWSAGRGGMIEGAVLARQGNREPAARVLADAADKLDAVGMKIDAEVARLAAARVRGDAAHGDAPVMREEGVLNPARFAAMMLPAI